VRGGPSPGQFEGDVHNLCLLCATAFPAVDMAATGLTEPSSMEFQDKVLTCIDCGAQFVFTAGEQTFFHDKQFKNEPKRCKTCKSKRVAILTAPPSPGNGRHYARVETQATCSQCGKETTVPFRPTQGRPVLCRECFTQKKITASA
jgi:CxxC-x17-CxxC domain-containing protein